MSILVLPVANRSLRVVFSAVFGLILWLLPGGTGFGQVSPAATPEPNAGSSQGYLASIIPTPGLQSSSSGTSAVRNASDSSLTSLRGSGEALNQIVPRRLGLLRGASPYVTGGFAPTLASSEPWLPFLGNQLVVLSDVNNSPVLANVTADYETVWNRQSNCSLNEIFDLGSATTPNAALITTLTGAQDYYHQLAGLTTKPDVFANGCGLQALGLYASNSFLALQPNAAGAEIVAQLGNAGVYITIEDFTANTFKTTELTSGANPGAFYVANLRGGNFIDLIETGLTDPVTTQPATAVYLGKGDGTFQTPTYYDVSANSYATAAGFTVDDVNGDGIPDIVVLNSTNVTSGNGAPSFSGTVTTLVGKGDGTFTIGKTSNLTWTDSLQAVTGDFNGDGKKDLLVGGTVLLGAGDGSFTQGQTNAALASINVDSAAAGGNVVGSLRNNGKLDVVAAVPGLIEIFYGNGDGTFQSGPSYAGLPDFMQTALTDVDGDGNLDIVTGLSTGGMYTQGGYDLILPEFQVLMGRGDGTFVDSLAYLQGTYKGDKAIASADFNGDSKPDVLVFNASNTGGTNSLVMLPGDGSGNLGAAVTSTLNNYPQFVVTAKMNHDTLPDAIVAGAGSNNAGPQVSVLTNSGNGTFANEQDYGLAGSPTSLATGDFNGDGLQDVAVGTSMGVFVLFGQSGGGLASPVQVDSAVNPTGLAAGSLTTDGRSDLVIADQATGTLRVYLGNANGTFTSKTAPTIGAANLVAMGDLNNDGKMDLIVGGFIPGTYPNPNVANVYTLLGNGDGTFQAATTLAIASNDSVMTSIAVGDLNKNGKLDVVLGNSSDLSEVLFGNGDGTFIETLAALAQRAPSLAIADLNGDGYPELLAGQPYADNPGYNLAVLLNQATWNVTTSITTPTVTVSPAPASITTAQSTSVTVTLSGGTGNSTPTGTVVLSSGTYTSAATTLTSGSAVISVAGSALAVGTDTLTATYTPDTASSTVYTSATGTHTVTVSSVTPASFTLSNGGAITISAPGASTGNTTTITVTPSGGFTGSVALTAALATSPSGAVDSPTFSFGSSSSVTISGSAASSTLTVLTTSATSGAAIRPNPRGFFWAETGGMTLACVMLFGLRRRRWSSYLGLLALLALATAAMSSCSGGGGSSSGSKGTSGNPGTTTGSYSITVTGTSGSITQTTTVNLTVN